MNQFVHPCNAEDLLAVLEDSSVDLLLTDPPYFGIVDDSWDNQWQDVPAFVRWLSRLFLAAKPNIKPHGSLVFFGGIGRHGAHPFFDVLRALEETYTFRNLITWGKRRAYGKTHDYLFCREEIAWYSVSAERTEVTFNVPYLDEKRGYAGWDPEHPAKSEYKRVTNVWSDIPELMRPERSCQKPLPLMERLVRTHSNPGDLIVDPFAGYGTTGLASLSLGRRFVGCEAIDADANAAEERCLAISPST